MENEKKLAHLEMIQGVINRMASNSFSLKGWAVTLVAGIFVLSSKDADKLYFLVAYLPVIAFWFLDSYYLMQGRRYRFLYDKVRKLSEEDIDFDMNAQKEEFKTKRNKFIPSLISGTEVGFYIPLALVISIIIIVTKAL